MRLLIPILLFAGAAQAADGIEQLQEALKLLDKLDKEGAEQLLTRVLKAEPRLAPVYVARGRLRVHLGQAEKAARDFERASRLGVDHWRYAGELYSEANAHDEAAEAFARAWQANGLLEDLIACADARAAASDMRGALLAYNEIVRRVKKNSAVPYLVERGMVKSALGLYEEALVDLDLAIRRRPRNPRAYQIRGRVYIRMGEVKTGLADFQRAVEQQSSHPSSYWILGLAQYDTGDFPGAVKSLERSVGFGEYVHPYAHLYLFLARCRTNQPAKRMQAARELMKFLESRDNPEDWFGKVGAYLTGSLDAKELLAAAETGNKHTRRQQLCEAHAYVAGRLMIARSPDSAREHFRKAVATKVQSFVEYNTSVAELRRVFRERVR